jgi:hypothetical protein
VRAIHISATPKIGATKDTLAAHPNEENLRLSHFRHLMVVAAKQVFSIED